ncbi:hypothetical protein MJ923_07815 [Shewanella sp. 3B26]|uniref:Uncharacterized protein n=1 Tax=Shewanella zhuhaiensis TaxID=2919576 RepID=A0AAJ1BGH2_9GAMM|nr:hypothetical protein [Shewanella zhuhaiensis]MCH4294210.1 hypothetical protein [Shewanella zhuhaiensis]
MFIRLVSVFIFIVTTVAPLSVYAKELNNDEKYLSINISPVCNNEGQFKIVFTNVSSGKIYIEKWMVDPELFEPVETGLLLFDSANKVGVELSSTKMFKHTSDFAVLTSGESVEHIVNVNNHLDGIYLDRTLTYEVGYDVGSDIILEDGRKIAVRLNTWLSQKSLVIEPSCWVQ